MTALYVLAWGFGSIAAPAAAFALGFTLGVVRLERR